jgi:PAS domain S-box-containing protein
VLTLVSTESKRTFTRLDVATAEQLAARASLAIENAMLYEDVEKERQRLKELVASVPGVVWEAYGKPDEASQRINFVSDYVEKMLGYTVQEWLETPNFWLSIVHPDDKQIAAEEALKKFRDDAESANRFRWIAKSGKLVWVEAHSRAITDKKGKKVGMRGVTMDVTERIELERRKDEFISIASHELKTPITSIKVFNQLLQKKFKEDDQASRYLNRMNVQIDKLTTLISDLLDVSKIQAGKLELRKEPLRLDSLVREIAETIDATAQNHHVEVRGSVSREVYADHDRIGQVIVNMLTNAIKYSPDSEKVVVTMSETADGATVSVTDYGVGIPDEHKDKIFERFYRVYDTRDKTFPGLGMGLYISEVIVRRHDGKMWFESTSGSGSTFHFRIPFPPRKSKSRT